MKKFVKKCWLNFDNNIFGIKRWSKIHILKLFRLRAYCEHAWVNITYYGVFGVHSNCHFCIRKTKRYIVQNISIDYGT